jgi:hypothetical protein
MDWLKTHFKRYGGLHLIALVFIIGGIWQASYDYNFAGQHKVGWDITKLTLLFHATFISLYFAVWTGKASAIYFSYEERMIPRSKEGKILLALSYSAIAGMMAMIIALSIVIYLEPHP